MAAKAVIWFRNDLRVRDNPALHAALQHGETLALFVHDTDTRLRPRGAASRWWLHHSLNALGKDLAGLGIPFRVAAGLAADEVRRELNDHRADAVFWNRRYAPAERAVDADIKADLKASGVAAHSVNGHLLVEPWDVATGAGKPYSVFTPFWNAIRQRDIGAPSPWPEAHGEPYEAGEVDRDYLVPDWGKKLGRHWTIGEDAARARLDAFIDIQLNDYAVGRDFPARDVTSRLSPHLAFGEISARQVWHAAQALAQRVPERAEAVGKFLSEIGWREFNYHQLYHREDISQVPMQPKYAALDWRRGEAAEISWQLGLTGFPIVDAGMRELWETGYMQNRVRMLTASLLAKNLLVDWRHGERWFWDCLVDADPASNPGNWQWVAGSGLDASPFFRIFNPVTQGERFDADGDYVRRWVPELAGLPNEFIQRPFDAPEHVLRTAGVVLGATYPHPIVDLKITRQRALDVLKALSD